MEAYGEQIYGSTYSQPYDHYVYLCTASALLKMITNNLAYRNAKTEIRKIISYQHYYDTISHKEGCDVYAMQAYGVVGV